MRSITEFVDPRFRRGRPCRRRGLSPFVEPLEGRELLTLLGQQLFPADNPWNQQITSAPVASNSAAIMNNIISLYGDGRFHPDFGQDTRGSNPLYGIPFNVVHGNTQPKVHVVIDDYADESDLQDAPIPANAVLEGDNQNGPVAGLANRGDSHLIVYDEDNNIAYEFYNASRPERELRRPVARRPGVGLGHEDQHVPHPGLDLGRRRGPADPAGTRPPRRGPPHQPGRTGRRSITRSASRCRTTSSSTSSSIPASHVANSGYERRDPTARWGRASASRRASTSRRSTPSRKSSPRP